MPRAWSKISINFTNAHVVKSGEPQRTFEIRPGTFYDNVPDWVSSHPVWKAATSDYTDPHGVEREADIVLFDDASKYAFPPIASADQLPISGTNVSENPRAGKPLKGASLRNVEKAAPPTALATVVGSLTDGAEQTIPNAERDGDATGPVTAKD